MTSLGIPCMYCTWKATPSEGGSAAKLNSTVLGINTGIITECILNITSAYQNKDTQYSQYIVASHILVISQSPFLHYYYGWTICRVLFEYLALLIQSWTLEKNSLLQNGCCWDWAESVGPLPVLLLSWANKLTPIRCVTCSCYTALHHHGSFPADCYGVPESMSLASLTLNRMQFYRANISFQIAIWAAVIFSTLLLIKKKTNFFPPLAL